MFYEIPATLSGEIDELDLFVKSHLAGEIDAESLKVRRVPFGCYEQRESGTYMLRIRCPVVCAYARSASHHRPSIEGLWT